MKTLKLILSILSIIIVVLTIISYIRIRIVLKSKKKIEKSFLEKRVKLFIVLTIITLILGIITMIINIII